LLLDPLEAKFGHFFCRGCITELLISSTDEQAHLCGVCQSMVCKNDMKELSPKASKLTSTLQHLVFCQAEGWRIGIINFYQTLKLFNKFVHIMY
jgi:predicted transcriptional regulator